MNTLLSSFLERVRQREEELIVRLERKDKNGNQLNMLVSDLKRQLWDAEDCSREWEEQLGGKNISSTQSTRGIGKPRDWKRKSVSVSGVGNASATGRSKTWN